MPISTDTIASYGGWGNAVLRFTLGGATGSVDPATGNYIEQPETLEYLAALFLEPPSVSDSVGVLETTYTARGRLLSPPELDPRITNGSRAEASINGVSGRFEFSFPLRQRPFNNPFIREQLEGTFRVRGGPN